MVSEQVLSRLFHAEEDGIDAIICNLSRFERAQLAVFCYARSHLRTIGLAIADTCEYSDLLEASGSNAVAQTLLAQAHGPRTPVERHHNGRRAITLPTAASAAKFLAEFEQEGIEDSELEDMEVEIDREMPN